MIIYNHPYAPKTKTRKQSDPIPEHEVLVDFHYEDDDLDPLHHLVMRLDEMIKIKQLGNYDGHEVDWNMGHARLYMYAFNAEHLFKAIKPILEEAEFMHGATALLRFCKQGLGTKEIDVLID